MRKIAINVATGGLQKKEMIAGIDPGITNSLVAIIHPDTNQQVALKEHDSSSLIPGAIHFAEHKEVVGEQPHGMIRTGAVMYVLQLALAIDDRDLILKKIEELNEISRQFAKRAMDMAIGEALRGKHI